MLDEIREKIGEEIEELVNELNVLLPVRIEKAHRAVSEGSLIYWSVITSQV